MSTIERFVYQFILLAYLLISVITELYLLAFGPLRSVFSAPELNQVADTMAERGLRLRKGLDEVLEGLQYPIMDQVEDEIDEDEIEYNASELRRLKPY